MLTYLALGKMGRFGNALFEIAGTIGIAIKSGQNYAFPKFINHDAKDRFASTEDIDLYKYFINPLPEIPNDIDLHWNNHGYFWGYRDIRLPQGNWNMEGHFQSEKYFAHCMDVVRFYFTMPGEIDNEYTAVHMRFGDYGSGPDDYHPCAQPEYYQKAFKEVPGPYLLFSDDLTRANEIMSGIGVYYIPVTLGYIESFKMMKCCKNFIGGNSSYSLMAAILAPNPNKKMSFPAKWFGSVAGLETIDLYPEKCIIL